MEKKIKDIMSAVFDLEIEKINEESSSKTIVKWDSLNHMNLIVALEEEFSMTFDEEEIIDMTNYRHICNLVTEKS
tara:strand:- start:24 stop:248 length:225 start_codon:yes stop_codon:yes gene_type:complete